MLFSGIISCLGPENMFNMKYVGPSLAKYRNRTNVLAKSYMNSISTCRTTTITSRSLGQYDLVVVGSGIVGCATARELKLRHPNLKMAIVEKETDHHQNSLNNGVIHTGIFHKPGSLQAKLCVEGMQLLYDYCNEKGIPYLKCGKLIVATNEKELKRLDDLYEYGLANNCPDIQMLNEREIREIEPYCKGMGAIWSPNTGSVNYDLVTERLTEDFVNEGGKVFRSFEVRGFDYNETSEEYPVVIKSRNKLIEAAYVLTCAGLHSDKLAAMTGCSIEPKMISFQRKFFQLHKDKIFLVKTHIYPVSYPSYPFLGAHFTPSVDGNVWVGPNTVPTFKRDVCGKWRNTYIRDIFELINYPGFRKFIFKNWLPGIKELSCAFSSKVYEYKLKKYIPYVEVSDIVGDSCRVQAQAVMTDGEVVNDFVFTTGVTTELSKRILHSRSVPSPAATSSLAIGKSIAEKVQNEFNLKT